MKFYEGAAPDWNLIPQKEELPQHDERDTPIPFVPQFVPRVKESKEENIFQRILEEAGSISIDSNLYRNAQGELLAPDGSVSHLQNELYWKIARTPSFKQWFGKSIVHHENGEPKVVYRGTLRKEGEEINPDMTFKVDGQDWNIEFGREDAHLGKFFSSSIDGVLRFNRERYSDGIYEYQNGWLARLKNYREVSQFLKDHEEKIKITSAFIKLENPFVEEGFRAEGKNINSSVSIMDFHLRRIHKKKELENMLKENHDGLYLPKSSDLGDEYAVVKNENIFILPSAIGVGKPDLKIS